MNENTFMLWFTIIAIAITGGLIFVSWNYFFPIIKKLVIELTTGL